MPGPGPYAPHTARALVHLAAQRFGSARLHFGHGTDNPLDEAVYLVLAALKIPFGCDESVLDQPLEAASVEHVLELIERRAAERVPTAYLVGEAWFAGLPFHVDRNVLVPRSPLAELIEERFATWAAPEAVRAILDIGTGSGCIAAACAIAFPAARVDAVDTDAAALRIAEQNMTRHGLQERVRCMKSDVYDALDQRHYDLIISNPPYVPAASLRKLPAEYGFEPAAGLFGGEDGLDVIRRIIAGASARLNPGGVLVVEVGEAQPALERAYPQLPFLWIEFERGGEGVFVLNREQLVHAIG